MDDRKERSSVLPMLALVKKNIIGAFETITKSNVFKFRLENDKVFYSYFAKVDQKLDRLIQSIVDLPKIEMKDSPASINIQTMGKETINKIVEELSGLREVVKSSKITLPQTQNVRGKLEVSNLQYVPYDKMIFTLKSIETKLGSLRIEVPKQQEKEIRLPEYPKEMSVPQIAKVIDAVKELKDEIKKIKPSKFDMPDLIKAQVTNFPPQKYPMPVTHMSINSLKGDVRSRKITVNGLTPLPSDELAYRRSWMVFNNDASSTLYIGGADLTPDNGLPVLAQTYSPVIDAGPDMQMYGTSTGSIDVRVFEASDENSGR